MAGSSEEKPQLPSAPSSLCFNKDEFMNDNFSIDRFVAECRKRVQLETLREDLGLYLRLLRTAMIELINQDYADFVNLSSNLVGLDKAISKLSVPLGELKEEVKSVKLSVDEATEQIEAKLKHRKRVREKKICLQQLMLSVQCVDRIETLLNTADSEIGSNGTVKDLLEGDRLERVAAEFNSLQFVVTQCKGLALIEQLKPRILKITTVLQNSLEESFLRSLKTGDLEGLRQILRIYAAIDKVRDAEDLFRKRIVAPYMESILDERSVRQLTNEGLQSMYSNVLKFIPKHCTNLKRVTDSLASVEACPEFDFLVNSIFPEVVASIEIRIPMLWDLTDPKAFHERYRVTMEFLDQFEQECVSAEHVARFRKHPSYTMFQNKWNVAVYFQIRFQEIAASLEMSFNKSQSELNNDCEPFLLPQTKMLWECLHTCWSPDVYLQALMPRFWKLTLLLLSRYTEWTRETFQTEGSKESTPSADGEASGGKSTMNGSMTWLPSRVVDEPTSSSVNDSLSRILSLTSDIHTLLQKIEPFLDEVVAPCAESCRISDVGIFSACVNDSRTELSAVLPRLSEIVTSSLSTQCCSCLKQVYDTPRLFRRTNREVPSKSSSYVSSLLRPLHSFLEDRKEVIPSVCRNDWIRTTVINVCGQYTNVTSDVLTSVKRMEDSLKRLKKARDKPNSLTTGNTSGVMSDDDKIRLQLALDVEHFKAQVIALGVNAEDLPSFQALAELVESARSSPAPIPPS